MLLLELAGTRIEITDPKAAPSRLMVGACIDGDRQYPTSTGEIKGYRGEQTDKKSWSTFLGFNSLSLLDRTTAVQGGPLGFASLMPPSHHFLQVALAVGLDQTVA